MRDVGLSVEALYYVAQKGDELPTPEGGEETEV